MLMYSKQNTNLLTRYTIEFIDNKKDMDYVNSGKINHGEPWERYKKKVFDNMDQALSTYMVYVVNESILDIKLFEEIILDGETIRESYIEPESTTAYYMKNMINKSMYESKNKTECENGALKNEVELFHAFINKVGCKKLFDDFIKEYSKTVA